LKTNDIGRQYRSNVAGGHQGELRLNGGNRASQCDPGDIVFAPSTPAQRNALITVQPLQAPPERTLELNRWLKNYSASQRYDFLDYFSAMSDGEGFVKRCLSEDGLHPTPAGYLVMARVAKQE
jgi:lysophospholipase L1-like esterase